MDTPLVSKPKSGYKRTFDETVHRSPLLFRLHSHSSHTLFLLKENILVASLHSKRLGLKDCRNEELPRRLAELKKTSSLLTPEETSEAVRKHITAWKEENAEPSSYISLTFNVLYVFWEWKRRMSLRQSKSLQEDFTIIVFNGSNLRASGKAKLGTEWLPRDQEKYKDAYRFTESHEEVIVENFIQPMAILGFMPISELVKFIPPQCQEPPEEKLSFQDYMRARLLHKFNHTRARGSLRFALALLAPMLVSDEQQHTNNGSVVGFYATEHPRAEGVDPEIDPRSGHETVLEQRVAENGTQSHSREIETQLARVGTTGDSPGQRPAKRRRLSEKESAVGSTDLVRDGQAPVEPLKWWSKCVGILAAEVCHVGEWIGRQEYRDFCTLHGHELLKRYRAKIQSGSGKTPGEVLDKIMGEYTAWEP